MQYNGIAMRWKAHVFFLWTWVSSTVGTSAYLHCQQTTNLRTLPPELKGCDVRFENGHFDVRCQSVLTLFANNNFPPAEKKIITMELVLVSETVCTIPQGSPPICLSIQSVRIKKWDYLSPNFTATYHSFRLEEWLNLGRRTFNFSLIPEHIREMTFDVTLAKSPPVAVIIPDGTGVSPRRIYSVYSFADLFLYAFPYPDNVSFLANTTRSWDISIAYTNAVITLVEVFGEFPTKFLEQDALAHIRQVVFHRCFFRTISFNEIPRMKSIQRLEFLQTPITFVRPGAFDLIPSVKNISLTGTKLHNIPEAIFSLKALESLNMADTYAFPNFGFEFGLRGPNTTSSAVQLITSGTNVTVLRDRDLCNFPNLHELHMDRCHLKILLGSPFICLKKLHVLSLQANEIRELNETALEGLTGLLRLNLTRNRLTVFHGTNILIPLVSLRMLDISFNSIQEIRVDKPLNSSPEVLLANHNRIKKWTSKTFSLMTELKILDVGYNEIAALDNEMFGDLKGIQNVSLNFNPWDCHSCYLNNLHNFLDNHQVQCAGCVACKVPAEQHGYPVQSVPWREEECVAVDYYNVYAVPGILGIMSAVMLVYGAYKCRWCFIYVSLYLKVGIRDYRRRVNVENYAWDAFVSYHASDSDWVHNVLLSKLESPPLKFRLCVAERDFIPGMPITENICKAITQSRVCLFVLSPAFCRSRWCMFEVRLAQHGLPGRERCDALIFIKKEQVRESEMSNTVLFLTKWRTYIEVPPSNATERQNNFFWLQLQAVLQR